MYFVHACRGRVVILKLGALGLYKSSACTWTRGSLCRLHSHCLFYILLLVSKRNGGNWPMEFIPKKGGTIRVNNKQIPGDHNRYDRCYASGASMTSWILFGSDYLAQYDHFSILIRVSKIHFSIFFRFWGVFFFAWRCVVATISLGFDCFSILILISKILCSIFFLFLILRWNLRGSDYVA